QGYVHGAFKGVLYQVGRSRPKTILVPCSEDWDAACGAKPCSGDLDVSKWFCQSQIIASIDRFPGTTCWLQNGYDIIAVRQARRRSRRARATCSQVNTTIHDMFSVGWRGNLIVFKRGCRDTSRVVNITEREVPLMNALVHRCVSYCFKYTIFCVALTSGRRWLEVELERLR
ncbi:hypothetical protein LXA43DRAFT_902531, partial [Ganoderma leucocontextum]